MANNQSEYTLSGITDTNEHDLPDTDGDDKSSAQNAWDGTHDDKLAIFITNHTGTDLTARLERSSMQDSAMNNPVTDTGSVTVSSNDTSVITADETYPMGYFRSVFSFNSTPSSADPSVTVRFETD